MRNIRDLLGAMCLVMMCACSAFGQSTSTWREDRLKNMVDFSTWPGRDNNVRSGFRFKPALVGSELVINALLNAGESPSVLAPRYQEYETTSGTHVLFKEWRVEYSNDQELKIAVGFAMGSPLELHEGLVRFLTRGSALQQYTNQPQFGDVTLRQNAASVVFCRDNVAVVLRGNWDPTVASVDGIAQAIDDEILLAGQTTVAQLSSFVPTLGPILTNNEASKDKYTTLDFSWSDPNSSNVEVRDVGSSSTNGSAAGVIHKDGKNLFGSYADVGDVITVVVSFKTDYLFSGVVTQTVTVVP